MLAIPALLPSSTDGKKSTATSRKSATQFKLLYAIGRVAQPPSTILTSLVFFYLSYRHYHHLGLTASKITPSNIPAEWKLWLAGCISVLGALVPFTLLVLEPTSHRILRHAGSEGDEMIGEKGLWTEDKETPTAAREDADEEDDVETGLIRWGVLNAFRATLPLVGTGFGLYAMLA